MRQRLETEITEMKELEIEGESKSSKILCRLCNEKRI